jgi:ClpP class serine protease
MKILSKLQGSPWAISAAALHNIITIAKRENESLEALTSKLGKELKNSYLATEQNGVAILPVHGPLFRYANLFTNISGAASYELIAADFKAALENPNISAIVLDIDSPGGEVNGSGKKFGFTTLRRNTPFL